MTIITCVICKKIFKKKLEYIQHLNKSQCVNTIIFNYNEWNKFDFDVYISEIIKSNIINNFFSSKNGYGKIRSLAIKLLMDVIELLKEFEIEYSAISGTLLGIIRHNNLIPWDDDIDLLVNYNIKDKFYLMYKKYKNIFHFIEYGNMLKICYIDKIIPIDYEIIKNASIGDIKRYNYPFIDLFIMKKEENKLLFFDRIWDINQFYPLQQIDFINMKINIPINPTYFLNINYGTKWNTELISNHYIHKIEKKSKLTFIIQYDEYKKYIKNI